MESREEAEEKLSLRRCDRGNLWWEGAHETGAASGSAEMKEMCFGVSTLKRRLSTAACRRFSLWYACSQPIVSLPPITKSTMLGGIDREIANRERMDAETARTHLSGMGEKNDSPGPRGRGGWGGVSKSKFPRWYWCVYVSQSCVRSTRVGGATMVSFLLRLRVKRLRRESRVLLGGVDCCESIVLRSFAVAAVRDEIGTSAVEGGVGGTVRRSKERRASSTFLHSIGKKATRSLSDQNEARKPLSAAPHSCSPAQRGNRPFPQGKVFDASEFFRRRARKCISPFLSPQTLLPSLSSRLSLLSPSPPLPHASTASRITPITFRVHTAQSRRSGSPPPR